MAMMGVIEPVEEVAYKNRPPLLEDVSIEGPLRIPISHALDTLEQRDAIEEDYNWWRYSKFAAPWLFFLLLLFATIFTLTALLQVGDLKGLRNGTPRYYQLETDSDNDNEAGMDKTIRRLRTAIPFFTLLPAVLAFIVLYSKPRPGPRKGLMIVLALLLVVGAILCFISFGVGEDDRKTARSCYELQAITNERCVNREGVATAALAVDFMLALLALTAAITLIWTTLTNDFMIPRTGWREQERDEEIIQRGRKNKPRPAVKAHKVRPTRMALTVIALLAVIIFAIASIVLMIVLHQYHNTIRLRSFRGLTSLRFDKDASQPFEESGWSARNTRLRYAWAAIGILTVLINFIPWRTRVLAWVFFFLYFCVGAMAFVSFGLDVHEMRESRDYNCPSGLFDVPYQGIRPDIQAILASRGLRNSKLNCINAPFVATATLEFITGIAIVIYLLFEYLFRWASVYSGRKYPFFEVRKIENRLDSRRPVRCELTSKVMTAKEYYYKHRFLAGPTTSGMSSVPSEFTESLFGEGPALPPVGSPFASGMPPVF
eukprot:TRINITY_DN67377_c10_g3_i2.p1 TRINITY_DN67377_c10_g3~~TRINITY_DN67377_c10_g3_i2.p1  ORF type:complete len:544 (-),score=64.51 TRINITY_DN67377_c10_g3_i2:248-1879(-)